MAYYFGKNVGSGVGPAGIAEQATTTSRDIEVVINTNANVPNREALAQELQALIDYIMGQAAKNW